MPLIRKKKLQKINEARIRRDKFREWNRLLIIKTSLTGNWPGQVKETGAVAGEWRQALLPPSRISFEKDCRAA
jgi:hypothetical protein